MGSIVYLGIICLLLSGCSRFEESEKEKQRHRNCHSELIYRNVGETFYPTLTPEHTPRSLYPWEAEIHLPRITQDFFRCKGRSSNLPLLLEGVSQPTSDCDGRHGLPNIGGKETVYPILIELLNHIQKKSNQRVIITSGHRCPIHNTYIDPAKQNQTSKHQIGAEVDFYVQGMEECPVEVAGLIMQYYQELSPAKNGYDIAEFQRVGPKSWKNKEIVILLRDKEEGRNRDNRHPYPYLTIQVSYDKVRKEKVVYEWAKAHQGYSRG